LCDGVFPLPKQTRAEETKHASTHTRNLSPVFQHLPEPNRACLVGVYAVTLDPPTFLIWNNLCDLVYQTPTKSYQRHIPVAFGIPDRVTYQTPTRHALLGSGSSWKTHLRTERTSYFFWPNFNHLQSLLLPY